MRTIGVEVPVALAECPDEHEALDLFGVPDRQLLGGHAASREPDDVGPIDLEFVEDGGGVVGHAIHGEWGVGQRRAADPAVVEGDGAVAGGEILLLKRPRFGGIAESGDEQNGRAIAALVHPEPLAGEQGRGHDKSSMGAREWWTNTARPMVA